MGNSIGTITVAGDLVQAAESVCDIELISVGASDQIGVTGRATIAAGEVLDIIQIDACPYVHCTQYMMLQAMGRCQRGIYHSRWGLWQLSISYDATHACRMQNAVHSLGP